MVAFISLWTISGILAIIFILNVVHSVQYFQSKLYNAVSLSIPHMSELNDTGYLPHAAIVQATKITGSLFHTFFRNSPIAADKHKQVTSSTADNPRKLTLATVSNTSRSRFKRHFESKPLF